MLSDWYRLQAFELSTDVAEKQLKTIFSHLDVVIPSFSMAQPFNQPASYERKVKDLIGDEAWTKIINTASSGRISAQQMKDVAWALPTDRAKDKIGAEHEIRMNEKGTKPNETEMKNILKDWFSHGDMPEERGEALEVLIKAFDENGNKPLARDLRKIKVKYLLQSLQFKDY